MDQAQQKWQFDWKQVGDYLLGRSTLIGIASMMLLTISAYATWHGMRDFIMGVSGEAPEAGGIIHSQRSPGDHGGCCAHLPHVARLA